VALYLRIEALGVGFDTMPTAGAGWMGMLDELAFMDDDADDGAADEGDDGAEPDWVPDTN
jgi:hypothetical protein